MYPEEFPPYYFVSGGDVRCPIGHDQVSTGVSTPAQAPILTDAQAIEGLREMQAKATAAREAAIAARTRATEWFGSLRLVDIGNN